jgi:hypothetical protein
MLIPNGGELGDYLRLGAYASDRALGASDPSAVQWFGSSLDEIESPDARLETTRRLSNIFSSMADTATTRTRSGVSRLVPSHRPAQMVPASAAQRLRKPGTQRNAA